MYTDGRMFVRWIRFIILVLHQFYRPTTSQCVGGLSCTSNPDCYLIFSQNDKYEYYKAASESVNDKAQSADGCYTFAMKEQASESCSDTRLECIRQGGTIVHIVNDNHYEALMNTVLHILTYSTEVTFNVFQSIQQEEQCAYVYIKDGVGIFNWDEMIQKPIDVNTTVNAVLCEQTDTPKLPSTISPLTSTFGAQTMNHQIFDINSITPEQNQQTGKTDKMRTPIVIVVVSGIIIVLLVFVGFAYFKIKKGKINYERAQNTLATTTNACRYSNNDVYYDVSQTNIYNDDSSTRIEENMTPEVTYTYAATEPTFVTSQRELQDTIGRNYEQPLLEEDDMYANVQTDAVVETDDCEYDKLNRSCAVTSVGDHDDTYNSLNEDGGDNMGHYDGLRRFKVSTENTQSPNQYGTLDHSI